jgi:hypothetical protein
VLAAVRSAAVLGIDAYDVTVEVDAALGLPAWTIVGLAAGAVRESRERVNAAIVNAGFAAPPRRVTVNLAPADTPKSGTAFDLPIAIALLMATGQLPGSAADGLTIVGEFGLDGGVLAWTRPRPQERSAYFRTNRCNASRHSRYSSGGCIEVICPSKAMPTGLGDNSTRPPSTR